MSMDAGDSSHLRGTGVTPDADLAGARGGGGDAVEAGGRTWRTGGEAIQLANGTMYTHTGVSDAKAELSELEEGSATPSYEKYPKDEISAFNLTEIADAREAMNGLTAMTKERFDTELGRAIESAKSEIPADQLDAMDGKVKEYIEEWFGFEGGEIPAWVKADDPLTRELHADLTALIKSIKEELIMDYVIEEGLDVGLDLTHAEKYSNLCEKHVSNLHTLAQLSFREADCTTKFEIYERSTDDYATYVEDHTFNEMFLNREDIAAAKEMMTYFDSSIEAYIGLLDKSAEELALAELPDVPNFTSLKLELYQKFFVDPETGGGWTPDMGIPSTRNVDNWISNVLKPAAEKSHAGDPPCTPLERRNATVYSMFEKMGILNGLASQISGSILIMDEGRAVILNHNSPNISNDNGSTVQVKDGVVHYRHAPTEVKAPSHGFFANIGYQIGLSGGEKVQKPEQTLKPGETVDLGDGITISLGTEPGAKVIIRYSGDEIYEGDPPPQMFEVGYETGRPQIYCRVEGEEMPVEQWISSTNEMTVEMMRDHLLGVQGYVHHSFDKSLERQATWARHDTRADLIGEEKTVRLSMNAANGDEEAVISRDVDRLFDAHEFALPDGIDATELGQVIFESRARQKDLANLAGTTLSGTVERVKSAFGSVKGLIFERTNNEEEVAKLQASIEKLEKRLDARPAPAVNEKLEIEAAIARLQTDLIRFEKDSVIAMMEACIEASTVNNHDDILKRPEGWQGHKATLDEAFQKLGEKLCQLEKDEAAQVEVAKSKQAALKSDIGSFSLVSTAMAAAKSATDFVGSHFTSQTKLEELARRKELADIGYNMGDAFNSVKDDFVRQALRESGKASADQLTPGDLTAAMASKAKRFAEVLRDNPELGAVIAADIRQIKDLITDQTVVDQLTNRLEAHALTKAFLEGVPEKKKTPEELEKFRSEVKQLQAIADFLRIAVPLTGAATGAAADNWVTKLAGSIPFVGGVAQVVAGAVYGGFKAETVRSVVTNMTDETRVQAYAVASAISQGTPKAFLEAHAKVDAARAAGEISKAFTDKGNFFSNFVFRGARAAKNWIGEKFGSLGKLFSSSTSVADKAVAALGIAAPVAGVAVGALAIAGVIATGPFLPLAAALIGFMYVASSYARTKQPVVDYLNDKKKADAKELAERFEKDKSPDMKQLREKYRTEAEALVQRGHKRGIYDADLRQTIAEFEAKPAEEKERKIKAYCADNAAEFAKFMEGRQAKAKKHFESVSDDYIQKEFFHKHLIREKMESFIQEAYQEKITRMTQIESGVDFSHEVEDPTFSAEPKRPKGKGIQQDDFDEIVATLDKTEAPLDSLRFSALDMQKARQAAAAA